ncbi:hypothetical protein ACHGLA_34920 [Streptomyces sp. YH02]|uniref:hypothetical protein n=1 Tax=Streptomyces sp. YH02 TaxID=3256999 RepID=UPI003757B7B3
MTAGGDEEAADGPGALLVLGLVEEDGVVAATVGDGVGVGVTVTYTVSVRAVGDLTSAGRPRKPSATPATAATAEIRAAHSPNLPFDRRGRSGAPPAGVPGGCGGAVGVPESLPLSCGLLLMRLGLR